MLGKILKGLAGFIVIAILTVVVIGFLLPQKWEIAVQETYNAPPAKVWPQIATLKNWPEWTAWNTEKYPEMEWAFSGPESGVGATQTWADNSSTGVLTVTSETFADQMQYKVSMDESKFQMDCGFNSKAVGVQTEITWSCRGDSGNNPLSRIFMKVFEEPMKKDFSVGLQRLKTRVES